MMLTDKNSIKEWHKPVMANQVIDALNIISDSTYVDATYGRGGHSRLILRKLSSKGRLYAIDCDKDAVKAARQEHVSDSRVLAIHARFSNVQKVLRQQVPDVEAAGIVADLGVSSPQLGNASRGFSFDNDGPLDMRMNTDEDESAADWLRRVDQKELEKILRELGEERYARRIAQAVVNIRTKRPLETTGELASLVSECVPTQEPGKHPATRTFRAIRMHINREIRELSLFLPQCLELLKLQGRLAVITFHSIEDRIVKRFMRSASIGAPGPQGVPFRQAEFRPTIRIIGRALRPSLEEINTNRQARSAILRVAEKIGDAHA